MTRANVRVNMRLSMQVHESCRERGVVGKKEDNMHSKHEELEAAANYTRKYVK